MKQIHFQVNIEQLCGFCPAEIEGYYWEFEENGKLLYTYDVVECYFNQDDDNLVEVTVVTNQPDAEPAGVQDSFLWNMEEEAETFSTPQ